MIEIKNNKDCCGCSACIQKCSKNCISLKENNEGFLYPEIDKSICIDCGLCEKVCPIIHQNEPQRPLKVYAAINNNENIRIQSSSGGIFSLLAEKIINEGGVVFGARFDENWEVKHDYTETIEGLKDFRGSKYVQSRIDDNYKKAEYFLLKKRKVLFSGTPCQIAGLKRYLQKEYDNLLTVDFICHGVPSPSIWRNYLTETIRMKCDGGKDLMSLDEMTSIKSITFRDKTDGWEKYGFKITINNTCYIQEHHQENVYMKAFLSNVSLRPSCYACPAKMQKSHSDITLSDLWISKSDTYLNKYNDDKGLSCVLLNTIESKKYLDSAKLFEISLEDGIKANPCYYKSVKYPDNRNKFWAYFLQTNDFITSSIKYGKFSILETLRNNLIKLAIRIRILGLLKMIMCK